MIMPADAGPGDDGRAEGEAAVDLGPLPSLFGYALRRALLAVSQDFQRHFVAEDIRPAQFSVLVVLKFNPGLRAARVAAALGIKRTNFVPLLDGLEKRKLAERRRLERDRRATALFLTETGAAMLARLAPLVAQHEAKFTARVGDDGRHHLLSLLHRLGEAGTDPPGL
jgi:DNA-binding MarR family transcriptional regulator